MDLKHKLKIALRRPADLPDALSPIKLKLSSVLEGLYFLKGQSCMMGSWRMQ